MTRINKDKIMIISSVHRWDDTRIFHKQAVSLSKKYDVELHAPATFKKKIVDGVLVFGLPKWRKEYGRIYLWLLLFIRIFKSKSEIIHFHDPELLPLCLLFKIFLKKKIIYDVHEQYVHSIAARDWIPKNLNKSVIKVFEIIEKICVPKFDAIIYTTRKVGERYINLSKNCVSIENYAKIETFKNSDSDISYKNNTIIYLGRVRKIRGIEPLIKSIKYVKDQIADIKLLIVGDIVPEGYEEELKEIIERYCLHDNVELVGYVPQKKAKIYLERSRCGVVNFLSNRHHKSCLPNKIFEYMATGLPIIASDFELYKEVVKDSFCGLTVDPSNPHQIADAIIYLIKNVQISKKMATNGKAAFMMKYNWEKEEIKLMKLYDKVFM